LLGGGKELKSIVVLDSKPYITQRIQEMFSLLDINVTGVSSSMELFNYISKNSSAPDMIIIELNLNKESGFDVIKKLKDKGIKSTIIIVSLDNRKDTIVRGFKEGAVDYILKPLNDTELITRLLKHIDFTKTENIGEKIVQMNFQEYLSSELRKASKGNYFVSVIMFALDNQVDNKKGIDAQEFLTSFDYIYKSLNELFWETDIFVKYGQQNYIGIFPFSDEKSTQVILNKIYKRFEILQSKEKHLREYKLTNSFVTYPTEGTGKEEILEILIAKFNATSDISSEKSVIKDDEKNVNNKEE
jgi:DNA-binding response OmpR family regulator